MRDDGVAVYLYEDGRFDVLCSFLEDESWAEEALPVIEEFRAGRSAAYEMGGNAHILQITTEAAEIKLEPLELRIRMSHSELLEAPRDWRAFRERERRRGWLARTSSASWRRTRATKACANTWPN